jgi:hypothetical protein
MRVATWARNGMSNGQRGRYICPQWPRSLHQGEVRACRHRTYRSQPAHRFPIASCQTAVACCLASGVVHLRNWHSREVSQRPRIGRDRGQTGLVMLAVRLTDRDPKRSSASGCASTKFRRMLQPSPVAGSAIGVCTEAFPLRRSLGTASPVGNSGFPLALFREIPRWRMKVAK